MELGLKGKVALVTGGSDGIGFAAAYEMALEGAEVIICARNQDNLEIAAQSIKESTGKEITTKSCDVTSTDAVSKLFSEISKTFGGIDILVNNAGTSSAHPFLNADENIWDYDIDLKLFGAIRCSQNAVPIMRSRGGGRIINVTTPGGKAPGPASVPTSVTRAAGIALTKAMSKDFASDNILVNTVCVGLIKSGQHRIRWENSDKKISLDDFYSQMVERVPMGRVGEAKEVGGLIAFLASDRGSYITGASINVDGGTSPVV